MVRAHFISSAEGDLAHAHVKLSQASLCELLAIKMLRHFAKNQIELVAVLTVNWHPIAGAPREVKDEVKKLVGGREDDLDDPASAIEVRLVCSVLHGASHMDSRLQLRLRANIFWRHLLHRLSSMTYILEE